MHIRDVELFAWLGQDEYGSGKIGLKQALVPAGMIAIVGVDRAKVDTPVIRDAMSRQGRAFGKTIRLVRFVVAEELVTLEP